MPSDAPEISQPPEEASPLSRFLGILACVMFIGFAGFMLKETVVREIEASHFDQGRKATAVATITKTTEPRRREAATISYSYEAKVGSQTLRLHETQRVSNALYKQLEGAQTATVHYLVDAPRVVDLRASKSALRWGSEGFVASWFLTLMLLLAMGLGLQGLIGYLRPAGRPAA